MSKQYIAVLGHTGKDPQTYGTKIGEVVKFSVAQKTGYGDSDRRWYNVTVFNEGLKERVKRELPKGTLVVVEGFAEEGEYNGQPDWKIVADRIGLVQAFTPTKKGQSAPVSAAAATGYSEDV